MASVQLIRKFISDNMLSHKRNATLGDDDDIFKLGFVNSMMALKLVTFVEKEFSVTIENDELDISTFNSVNQIARFVERKLGAPLDR